MKRVGEVHSLPEPNNCLLDRCRIFNNDARRRKQAFDRRRNFRT